MIFFFNATPTTEIYTLSLHDALPILIGVALLISWYDSIGMPFEIVDEDPDVRRSEEHTSELQSLRHLVCRLLLEKKKKKSLVHARRPPLRPARHRLPPSEARVRRVDP